ncbi:hypothetical protein IFU39_16720 [Paenibacillus sp. CFBP 13594]|uniref:ParB/Srx family N-terminal domain-containing protein n=1 Tax=Paenibacillus sp. CFBP 13594 TaxID=2774037 RepID=UPI001782AFC6|nr:ParB/Srx family N-terminal domain-containing protein [Paenibacillus sp. CFBP 13594]MBD8839458.1 hypothetical protein [Paenibacillus sp. CFBP 13594]
MDEDLVVIYLDRLRESTGLNPDRGFEWNESEFVNLRDITDGLRNGLIPEEEPYGDEYRYEVKSYKDKEWHVRRVIYYVKNPHEITGIQIDNQTMRNYILPSAKVIDGNHRLLAALWLGLETVKVFYGGRQDVLDYLCGTVDDAPEDVC